VGLKPGSRPTPWTIELRLRGRIVTWHIACARVERYLHFSLVRDEWKPYSGRGSSARLVKRIAHQSDNRDRDKVTLATAPKHRVLEQHDVYSREYRNRSAGRLRARHVPNRQRNRTRGEQLAHAVAYVGPVRLLSCQCSEQEAIQRRQHPLSVGRRASQGL